VHGWDKPGHDADSDSLNVTATFWGLRSHALVTSIPAQTRARRNVHSLITERYCMGLRFHTPTVNGQSTEECCGSIATR
jgi:hypothetical protein